MTTELIVTLTMTLPFVAAWAFLWWHNAESAFTLRGYLSKHSKLFERMKSVAEILIAWVFGLFMPVLTYLQIVYFLTFADFVMGVTAALLVSEAFSWRKARFLIAKFVAWTLLLASTYQIQLLLHIPTFEFGDMQFSIAILVAGVIAYAEFKSILDNIKKAFGIDLKGFLTGIFPILKNFDPTETEKKNDT
jgi:Bacteriophage holin family